jgi:hypothetical protein
MQGYLTSGQESPRRLAAFTGEFAGPVFTGKLLSWEPPDEMRAAQAGDALSARLATMNITAVLADGRSFRVYDLELSPGDMSVTFWITELSSSHQPETKFWRAVRLTFGWLLLGLTSVWLVGFFVATGGDASFEAYGGMLGAVAGTGVAGLVFLQVPWRKRDGPAGEAPASSDPSEPRP